MDLTKLGQENLATLWDDYDKALLIVEYETSLIKKTNQVALNLFGYQDENQLLDTKIHQLNFDNAIKIPVDIFSSSSLKEEILAEYKKKDNQIIKLKTIIYPLKVEESKYLLYEFENITDDFKDYHNQFKENHLQSDNNLFKNINNLEDEFIAMQSKSEFESFLEQLLDLILNTLNLKKGFIIVQNFFKGSDFITATSYDFNLDDYQEISFDLNCNLSTIKVISQNRKKLWSNKLDLESEEQILNFIIERDNNYLGEIVIIDDNNHDYYATKKLLKIYSSHIKLGINNLNYFLQDEKNKKINHELDIAARIQSSFMPKSTPRYRNFELAIYAKPAAEVGGDYLGFNEERDQFNLLISDVMGKGIPAAIVVATIHSAFNILSRLNHNPAEILSNLNYNLHRDLKNSATFVSALSASIVGNELIYSNAAASPLLFWSQQEKSLNKLNESGILCGIKEEYDYSLNKTKLSPGDLILFYTDGLTDIQNNSGERFGLERLEEIIRADTTLSAEDLKEKIIQNIYLFSEEVDYPDDITFVIAKFVGKR